MQPHKLPMSVVVEPGSDLVVLPGGHWPEGLKMGELLIVDTGVTAYAGTLGLYAEPRGPLRLGVKLSCTLDTRATKATVRRPDVVL